jgi:uncharacterized membrane protein
MSGGIFLVAGLRLLMAPYPNIEPIMLFTLSTALVFGPLAGFLIGFGSMAFADTFLGMAATIYTSLTYGAIGLVAGFIGMSKNKWGREELTALTFLLTVVYDVVTASFFAIQFMIPWGAAMITQVPATLLHLSNCVFVYFFAPYLMRFFEEARDFSIVRFLRTFRFYA